MTEEANWIDRMKVIIKNKTHPIGIVGLGYVGLPLAVTFAQKGYKVIGFDVDTKKTGDINYGISPIADVKNVTLGRLVRKGLLHATTDARALSRTFVIIICVPTPLNKNKQPDLSYVETSAEMVGRVMCKGALVVLESTSYPGTTRDVVAPIIERAGEGKKYFLAYSPERVDPSSRTFTFKNTPKLVAGLDTDATDLAVQLYETIVKKVIRVSKPEIGEIAKIFENVYRSVNIGLVNELALMCERLGLSVWEVLDAAETKPFGFNRFNPSPGVGGHCIPIDPYYLDQKVVEVGYHSRFIRVAMDINEGMPEHVVEGIARALDQKRGKALSKSIVLVLGVAYKPNVADIRGSPAVEIIRLLKDRGARIYYHDPFVPELPDGTKSVHEADLPGVIKDVGCVVLATDHSMYATMGSYIIENSRLLYDTRGWSHGANPPTGDNVVRLGE